jgi:hypothetical protein
LLSQFLNFNLYSVHFCGERQSVGFPVDSGFATARQSRERASAQRDSTEVDRIEVEIEKLREQLGQNEELRSMQENAYREREGSPSDHWFIREQASK